MKELEQTTQSVPKGKRYCTICGEVKRLHYFEGDSTHCSACCEKMLHTRVNLRCIPAILILLAAAAVSVFLCVYTVPYCMSLFRADATRRDKRLEDACSEYAAVVADASERNARILAGGKTDDAGSVPTATWIFFEAGANTWSRYLETYGALYSEYEAADLASGSLHADVIARIPSIARFSEAKQAFDDTMAFAEKSQEEHPFTSPEDMPYDVLMHDLETYADGSDSRYVKGYAEYAKGMATKYYKTDDPEASFVYFEKMLEYIPNEFMTAYNAEADAAVKAGNYALAIEAYEKILARNKNYTSAYTAIAEAAFYAGDDEKLRSALAYYDEDDPVRLYLEMWFALRSDNLDEAAAVHAKAQQTIKVQADKVFQDMLARQSIDEDGKSLLNGYIMFALEDAAYALLKDDMQEAFRIAYDEAFNYTYYYTYITNDSAAFSQSVINMATLCATLVKDSNALKTVREIGQCDETTQQVIDGKLTLRDVFVEGKAEIL